MISSDILHRWRWLCHLSVFFICTFLFYWHLNNWNSIGRITFINWTKSSFDYSIKGASFRNSRSIITLFPDGQKWWNNQLKSTRYRHKNYRGLKHLPRNTNRSFIELLVFLEINNPTRLTGQITYSKLRYHSKNFVVRLCTMCAQRKWLSCAIVFGYNFCVFVE